MHRLCADIVGRCAELRHIYLSRLLIGVTQAKSGRHWGLQARLTPLRFRGGALARRRGDLTFHVQRYFVDRRELLYLMTFCLPRFLDQTFDEKLVTIFHELYHIGPACDGDLRRLAGRCGVHSPSKRGYDRFMACLAQRYLATDPDPQNYDFLRLSFSQLRQRHRFIEGMILPRPRVITVSARK
jgi:hypothetical protein